MFYGWNKNCPVFNYPIPKKKKKKKKKKDPAEERCWVFYHIINILKYNLVKALSTRHRDSTDRGLIHVIANSFFYITVKLLLGAVIEEGLLLPNYAHLMKWNYVSSEH